jgi:hypothetical protein
MIDLLARPVLAAVILLPVATAYGQEERTFGNWTASCSPDGICRAVTGASPVLSLERHPQQTFWELSIEVSSPPPPYEQDPTIDVDDVAEVFDWYNEFGPYGAPNRFYFLGGKAQAALAEATALAAEMKLREGVEFAPAEAQAS